VLCLFTLQRRSTQYSSPSLWCYLIRLLINITIKVVHQQPLLSKHELHNLCCNAAPTVRSQVWCLITNFSKHSPVPSDFVWLSICSIFQTISFALLPLVNVDTTGRQYGQSKLSLFGYSNFSRVFHPLSHCMFEAKNTSHSAQIFPPYSLTSFWVSILLCKVLNLVLTTATSILHTCIIF
jgi:hypothetical protein